MRTRHESDCDEHGIFSGRWEIDLTLKEHQKVEAGPEFELVLFGLEGFPTSCTPPLHARLFHIQNPPKSQICHLSANATNRATSLKVGRYIEVVVEKLCRTFYAKIINHYIVTVS